LKLNLFCQLNHPISRKFSIVYPNKFDTTISTKFSIACQNNLANNFENTISTKFSIIYPNKRINIFQHNLLRNIH